MCEVRTSSLQFQVKSDLFIELIDSDLPHEQELLNLTVDFESFCVGKGVHMFFCDVHPV